MSAVSAGLDASQASLNETLLEDDIRNIKMVAIRNAECWTRRRLELRLRNAGAAVCRLGGVGDAAGGLMESAPALEALYAVLLTIACSCIRSR